MVLTHVVIGILLAIVIWKILKITFKAVLWLILIGVILHFVLPGGLFLVGGIGFLILIVLGTLLILSIGGLLFIDDELR